MIVHVFLMPFSSLSVFLSVIYNDYNFFQPFLLSYDIQDSLVAFYPKQPTWKIQTVNGSLLHVYIYSQVAICAQLIHNFRRLNQVIG